MSYCVMVRGSAEPENLYLTSDGMWGMREERAVLPTPQWAQRLIEQVKAKDSGLYVHLRQDIYEVQPLRGQE